MAALRLKLVFSHGLIFSFFYTFNVDVFHTLHVTRSQWVRDIRRYLLGKVKFWILEGSSSFHSPVLESRVQLGRVGSSWSSTRAQFEKWKNLNLKLNPSQPNRIWWARFGFGFGFGWVGLGRAGPMKPTFCV